MRGYAIGLRLLNRVADTGLLHVAPRPHGQLAHGCRVALEHLGHILQRHVEYVVQQEGRALKRGKPFEREHQSECHVIDDGLGWIGRLHQRLGQPCADIRLAPSPRRFHPVEAQPGDDAGEEGAGTIHRLLPAVPAQPGVLHHVLGLRDRSKHPIGEPRQPRPFGLKIGQAGIRLQHGSPSAWACPHRPCPRCAARGSQPAAGSRC